jgi:hypothetical protein
LENQEAKEVVMWLEGFYVVAVALTGVSSYIGYQFYKSITKCKHPELSDPELMAHLTHKRNVSSKYEV